MARLRIEVFRAWPYLYEGTPEYEAEYLQTYLRSSDSLAVLILDGERVVGASTALPLAHETEPFRAPFSRPEDYFYLGESVLLPAYRGQGWGVRFFEEREAHARRLGYAHTCFAAVQRPAEHPLRPADYVPLDEFWGRRGYRKHPELTTTYAWQDVDQKRETDKPMTFWLKTL